MKKVLALILAAMMILALASCGSNPPAETTPSETTNETTTNPENTTEATTQPQTPGATVAVDALDFLNKVWTAVSAAYEETFGEDVPSFMGGDLGNIVMGAPGKYSLEQENLAMLLDNEFGISEGSVSVITSAASVKNMMNANTFTCGAWQLTDASEANAVANGIKENLLGRHWMCGFPDTLVVIAAGEYVVSAFGNAELIETFKTATLSAIDGATLLCEESLAF